MQGGDYVSVKEAGLPNIVGTLHSPSYYNTPQPLTSGAFRDAHATIGIGAAISGEVPWIYTFNAANSSPIYGNSDTIQPPAIALIPQIKY